MLLRLFVLALGACLLGSLPASSAPIRRALAGVSRDEPLRVRFYDPYRLVSREIEDRIQEEVTTAFERIGVGIRFVDAGAPGVLPATLYAEIPESWGVASHAIGVAIGTDGERRSVFLSLGAAERAIGLRRKGAGSRVFSRGRRSRSGGRVSRRKTARLPAPAARRLGTALGRVLAHELTHSIAPACPHTRTGLMAPRLSRQMLTAPGVEFDELAAEHLRRGTRAWSRVASGSG